MSRRVQRSPKSHHQGPLRLAAGRARRASHDSRPVAAFRQRGRQSGSKIEDFNAPERWHAPRGKRRTQYIVHRAGAGFIHAVSPDDVRDRLALLPARFTRDLEVVQFSSMTRKREFFPCYGMQWGAAVYLYPIEESLEEVYQRPPSPQ